MSGKLNATTNSTASMSVGKVDGFCELETTCGRKISSGLK